MDQKYRPSSRNGVSAGSANGGAGGLVVNLPDRTSTVTPTKTIRTPLAAAASTGAGTSGGAAAGGGKLNGSASQTRLQFGSAAALQLAVANAQPQGAAPPFDGIELTVDVLDASDLFCVRFEDDATAKVRAKLKLKVASDHAAAAQKNKKTGAAAGGAAGATLSDKPKSLLKQTSIAAGATPTTPRSAAASAAASGAADKSPLAVDAAASGVKPSTPQTAKAPRSPSNGTPATGAEKTTAVTPNAAAAANPLSSTNTSIAGAAGGKKEKKKSDKDKEELTLRAPALNSVAVLHLADPSGLTAATGQRIESVVAENSNSPSYGLSHTFRITNAQRELFLDAIAAAAAAASAASAAGSGSTAPVPVSPLSIAVYERIDDDDYELIGSTPIDLSPLLSDANLSIPAASNAAAASSGSVAYPLSVHPSALLRAQTLLSTLNADYLKKLAKQNEKDAKSAATRTPQAANRQLNTTNTKPIAAATAAPTGDAKRKPEGGALPLTPRSIAAAAAAGTAAADSTTPLTRRSRSRERAEAGTSAGAEESRPESQTATLRPTPTAGSAPPQPPQLQHSTSTSGAAPPATGSGGQLPLLTLPVARPRVRVRVSVNRPLLTAVDTAAADANALASQQVSVSFDTLSSLPVPFATLSFAAAGAVAPNANALAVSGGAVISPTPTSGGGAAAPAAGKKAAAAAAPTYSAFQNTFSVSYSMPVSGDRDRAVAFAMHKPELIEVKETAPPAKSAAAAAAKSKADEKASLSTSAMLPPGSPNGSGMRSARAGVPPTPASKAAAAAAAADVKRAGAKGGLTIDPIDIPTSPHNVIPVVRASAPLSFRRVNHVMSGGAARLLQLARSGQPFVVHVSAERKQASTDDETFAATLNPSDAPAATASSGAAVNPSVVSSLMAAATAAATRSEKEREKEAAREREREQSKSIVHGVVHIDLRPFLKPGTTRLAGDFPIIPISNSEAAAAAAASAANAANAANAALLLPDDASEASGGAPLLSHRSAIDRQKSVAAGAGAAKPAAATATAAGAAKKPAPGKKGDTGPTAPAEPVESFEAAHSSLRVTIQLTRPLIPSRKQRTVTPPALASSGPVVTTGGKLAIRPHRSEEVKQQQPETSSTGESESDSALSAEYRSLMARIIQLLRDEKQAAIRTGSTSIESVPIDKEQLLSRLYGDGTHHLLKQRLKPVLVSLLQKHFHAPQPATAAAAAATTPSAAPASRSITPAPNAAGAAPAVAAGSIDVDALLSELYVLLRTGASSHGVSSTAASPDPVATLNAIGLKPFAAATTPSTTSAGANTQLAAGVLAPSSSAALLPSPLITSGGSDASSLLTSLTHELRRHRVLAENAERQRDLSLATTHHSNRLCILKKNVPLFEAAISAGGSGGRAQQQQNELAELIAAVWFDFAAYAMRRGVHDQAEVAIRTGLGVKAINGKYNFLPCHVPSLLFFGLFLCETGRVETAHRFLRAAHDIQLAHTVSTGAAPHPLPVAVLSLYHDLAEEDEESERSATDAARLLRNRKSELDRNRAAAHKAPAAAATAENYELSLGVDSLEQRLLSCFANGYSLALADTAATAASDAVSVDLYLSRVCGALGFTQLTQRTTQRLVVVGAANAVSGGSATGSVDRALALVETGRLCVNRTDTPGGADVRRGVDLIELAITGLEAEQKRTQSEAVATTASSTADTKTNPALNKIDEEKSADQPLNRRQQRQAAAATATAAAEQKTATAAPTSATVTAGVTVLDRAMLHALAALGHAYVIGGDETNALNTYERYMKLFFSLRAAQHGVSVDVDSALSLADLYLSGSQFVLARQLYSALFALASAVSITNPAAAATAATAAPSATDSNSRVASAATGTGATAPAAPPSELTIYNPSTPTRELARSAVLVRIRTNSYAWMGLALAAIRTNYYSTAEQALVEACSLDDKNPRVWALSTLLGLLLHTGESREDENDDGGDDILSGDDAAGTGEEDDLVEEDALNASGDATGADDSTDTNGGGATGDEQKTEDRSAPGTADSRAAPSTAGGGSPASKSRRTGRRQRTRGRQPPTRGSVTAQSRVGTAPSTAGGGGAVRAPSIHTVVHRLRFNRGASCAEAVRAFERMLTLNGSEPQFYVEIGCLFHQSALSSNYNIAYDFDSKSPYAGVHTTPTASDESANPNSWRARGLALAELALRRSLLLETDSRVQLLLAHVLRDARRLEDAENVYRQVATATATSNDPAVAAALAADPALAAGAAASTGIDREHAVHALKGLGVVLSES